MIHRCECGNPIYFSDSECSHCGRRLDFESKENSEKKSEIQLKLFSARKEKQGKLFKC